MAKKPTPPPQPKRNPIIEKALREGSQSGGTIGNITGGTGAGVYISSGSGRSSSEIIQQAAAQPGAGLMTRAVALSVENKIPIKQTPSTPMRIERPGEGLGRISILTYTTPSGQSVASPGFRALAERRSGELRIAAGKEADMAHYYQYGTAKTGAAGYQVSSIKPITKNIIPAYSTPNGMITEYKPTGESFFSNILRKNEGTILGSAGIVAFGTYRYAKGYVLGRSAIIRPAFYTKELPYMADVITRPLRGQYAPEIGQALMDDPFIIPEMAGYTRGFGKTTSQVSNLAINTIKPKVSRLIDIEIKADATKPEIQFIKSITVKRTPAQLKMLEEITGKNMQPDIIDINRLNIKQLGKLEQLQSAGKVESDFDFTISSETPSKVGKSFKPRWQRTSENIQYSSKISKQYLDIIDKVKYKQKAETIFDTKKSSNEFIVSSISKAPKYNKPITSEVDNIISSGGGFDAIRLSNLGETFTQPSGKTARLTEIFGRQKTPTALTYELEFVRGMKPIEEVVLPSEMSYNVRYGIRNINFLSVGSKIKNKMDVSFKPKMDIRQNQIQSTMQSVLMNTSVMSTQSSKQNILTNTRQTTSQRQVLLQKSLVMQQNKLVQLQKTSQVQKVILTPSFVIPGFKKRIKVFGNNKERFFNRLVTFNPKYFSSIEANIFNIKGKRPSWRNIATGLNIRPMVKI